MPASQEPCLLFVVGLYRSGTSLLYALLNQHPQIALMYEADALSVPGVLPTSARWPRWAERTEQWGEALSRHRIALAALESGKDVRALYAAVAPPGGAKYIGEKAPAYSRWLGRLATRFPEARIIILLRELPEICQSIGDAGARGSRFFARPGQLPRILWSQRLMLREAKKLEAKGFPLFYLRYREVMDDVAGKAREICDFLGLEFSEEMTSLESADLSAVHVASHHDQLHRGVIERREERWQISDRQREELRAFSQASGQPPFRSEESSPPLSGKRWLTYHCLLGAGCVLCGLDDLKRLLYEYLPAAWFRSYRRFRNRSGHPRNFSTSASRDHTEF